VLESLVNVSALLTVLLVVWFIVALLSPAKAMPTTWRPSRAKAAAVLFPIALVLGLLFGAIGQERDRFLALQAKIADLESENSKLLEELRNLKQTDQGLWQTSKEQESTQNWGQLESTLDELLSRWPQSPLIDQASALRRKARENIARSMYADAQEEVERGRGEVARTNLRSIVDNYSETSAAKQARADLRELDKKLKAAAKARAEAAKKERRARQRASAVLELTSFSWRRQRRYAIVEGQVKNISSRPLENVQAVALFHDPQGEFIKSDTSLIEYRPLRPGQSSPFKVMSSWNPSMKSCRVEFKQLMGGELPTFHNWR